MFENLHVQWVLRKIKIALAFFFAFTFFLVILYRFLPPPLTPLMLIRVTEQIFSPKPIRLNKDWTAIENISPNMPLAIVAAEDQLFTTHDGFDFKSIKKAYDNNSKRKRVKGGSTISQQVAKNVFLWPGRSWIRKGFEVYFTVMIEVFWGKKRIMEMYLNVAETGEGMYGVEVASQKYFNKPSKNLTRSQAALIAATLPNPRKWSPAKPTSYIIKRKDWIVRNMANLGKLKF